MRDGQPAIRAGPDLAGKAPPFAEQRAERLDKHAMPAAMADGISTGLAISSGALEMNPLISTSPAGLIALTGAKIGLVKRTDRLPEAEKRLVIKTWCVRSAGTCGEAMQGAPPLARALQTREG